jgi:hypothetical protein
MKNWYEKVYIYELIVVASDGTLLRYIGSTGNIKARMSRHKSEYKQWVLGRTTKYCWSAQVVEHEGWTYNILETVYDVSREQLSRMEGEYQAKLPCVNFNRAGRTRAEYYRDNRSRCLADSARCHKRRVACNTCGLSLTRGNLNRHVKKCIT